MSSEDHKSGIARLLAKADLLGQLTGGGFDRRIIHHADWANEKLFQVAKKDPFIRADRQHGLGSTGGVFGKISDWAYNHPADAVGIATTAAAGGAAAGGGAAGGGGGAGAAGGGAGAGTAAGGAALGAGAVDAALPTVTVVGSSGGGGAALGAAGGAAGGVAAANSGSSDSKGFDWQRFARNQMGGQQQQQKPQNDWFQKMLDEQRQRDETRRAIAMELAKNGYQPNTSFPIYDSFGTSV